MNYFLQPFYYLFFFSVILSEKYVCSHFNADNPNDVEIITYTRRLYDNSAYEYFTVETNTYDHKLSNIILSETDEYITLVSFIQVPVANLLVTFINKKDNMLYERFNSYDPEFDSDKTYAECVVGLSPY